MRSFYRQYKEFLCVLDIRGKMYWPTDMADYIENNWQTSIINSDLKKPYKNFTRKDIDVAIRTFKEVIQKCEDSELKCNMNQDEKTLQKFLYARKFQLDDTLELYKNYYWYRKRNPQIFGQLNLEASDIRKALINGLPGVLKDKDRKGRCILLFTGSNWDCSYSLVSIYRALLFSLDHLTNDIHNQANGFVIIVDWTEFSYRQTSQLKPSILRLMIEGLQNCYPARFKGIHFIGQPWYVDTALTVIKPFLIKEQVQERIYAHGNNLSTLHELVHRDVLPAELGGEKPSYNPGSFLESLEQNNNPDDPNEKS